MSSEPTVRRGVLKTLWSRKWRLIVPAVIGAAAAAIVSAAWPARYVSQTTIMVVPPRVGSDYVRPAVTTPVEVRLRTIRQQVTSRTRLERIIKDFNLYADELSQGGIMEEIVDDLRHDIDVEFVNSGDGRGSTSFRVGFSGSDPRTVMRVTEKLAGSIIEESLQDRKATTENAIQFLESQIEDAGRRLNEFETKLQAPGRKPTETMAIELDVLREHYRSLLQKREDVRISANLESRQIGETFKVVDVASFPEKPSGPTRTQLNFMGIGAGLVMGLVLVAAAPRRRT